MTTNHTPTPYRVAIDEDNLEHITKEDRVYGSIIAHHDEEDWHIARIWSDGPNPAEDAAFLVHAANHHDALRAALKEALDALALLQHVADPVAADAAQGATCIIRDGRRILSESAT